MGSTVSAIGMGRPAPIVSVERMRELEAGAAAMGVSEAVLQERAGVAVAEQVLQLATGGSVLVLVGHGNNGRDGAVAARNLAQRGRSIDLLLGPRHALKPFEVEECHDLGIRIHSLSADVVSTLTPHAGVVVDALLGVGTTEPMRDPFAAVAEALNRQRPNSGHRVVSIDVPSGINADTGGVPGNAVRADTTLALGSIQPGLLMFPAADFAGDVRCHSIGIPGTITASEPFVALTSDSVSGLVPGRAASAHKYAFGRVLVIAGSVQYPGAALLCATAAARAGAGLIAVACGSSVRNALAATTPEVTYVNVDLELPRGASAILSEMEPLLDRQDAVLVGPGLGRAPERLDLVRAILRFRAEQAARWYLVLDADALFALSESEAWWHYADERVVLTPHSGELALLAAGHQLDLNRAPWQEAARLASLWHCTLVAKGPFTSVARPDGRADVWTSANSALATGGTGDVLAGICASFLAQHLSAWDAARLAVAVHALAGRSALVARGSRTLLASDLWNEIPRILERLATANQAP